MRILSTDIPDVAIVELAPMEDERGFFARSYDRAAFQISGLMSTIEQANVSFNHVAGTVRGLHYQVAPDYESKLVRCTRGGILDVIVDMRSDSATYLHHLAVELTADNRRALVIPPLFAHGFQTLVDETEVHYQVSGAYAAKSERGLRYDDPALDLPWAMPVTQISDKDRAWPLISG